MKISKIIIENFKSIEKIQFDIKKHGTSYTTMLLGVNESGKTNVLEAMSYLETPQEDFDYDILHNQKDEKNGPIDLWFYLDFENISTCLDKIREEIENGDLLNFEIKSVIKNVYLQKGETKFNDDYEFKIEKLSKHLYIRRVVKNNIVNSQNITTNVIQISKNNDESSSYVELTEEVFRDYFEENIVKIIKVFEPTVSFWRASESYLISSVDLNKFKDNIYSNVPLKNIFALAGHKTKESIKQQIESVSNSQLRRRLMATLSESTTNYVNKIWKHKIEIDIEISDSCVCTVSVKDEGEKNKHNFHKMSVRSEGFKQFISLILSLSIETKTLSHSHRLILIDEPESHLHPSGIRDLREELLEIGKNNYLFASTHSPFLVDRKNKERNIIIKKNDYALTEKKEITQKDDLRDDEVLDLAFGINTYKDLLIPKRVLVEGASDKIILQKAFNLKKLEFGITNGVGSNIVQIAAKLNDEDISILVVTDDDKHGRLYRDKIIKIGGVFNNNNVFTIRDLVGACKNAGTIEDLFDIDFLQSKFKEFYKTTYKKELLQSLDNSPVIEQIKKILYKDNLFSEQTLIDFKVKISNEFNPSLNMLTKKHPLLLSLTDAIADKIASE